MTSDAGSQPDVTPARRQCTRDSDAMGGGSVSGSGSRASNASNALHGGISRQSVFRGPAMGGSFRRKDQSTYMRSGSINRMSLTPKHVEFPYNVASQGSKWTNPKAQRPVNRRNYVSPDFWVQSVENNETSRTASYLDYGLTNAYHQFWKAECRREELQAVRSSGYLLGPAANAKAKQRALIERLTKTKSMPDVSQSDVKVEPVWKP